MHPSQLVGDARGLAQDLHEQAAAADVAAKSVVDEVTILADQPDGRGPNPLELRVLL